MGTFHDQIEAFIKRVRDLADHVRGNEQATKLSLIGPFFTMLGYDLTDPREVVPEYKADFGKDRSVKPIDWAFKHNGTMAFFVEAKEVGRKLQGFDEQLADYFAKEPSVKVGILTNGSHWRFFTDIVNENVMDREPFASWDILGEGPPPFDVLTLLQKAHFNSELIRAYAQRQRAQNLLVSELNRLLEPSTEFTKLAIANIETRMLRQEVVEHWKPVVASALQEWAKQRTLTAVLTHPPSGTREVAPESSRIETTQEELNAFECIRKLVGADRAIAYEDTVSYFKLHVAEKRTWVFARLQVGRKDPRVWVAMPEEAVKPHVGTRAIVHEKGWTMVALAGESDIGELGALLSAAYDHVLAERAGAPARTGTE